MKKTFLICLFGLFSFSCFAQSTPDDLIKSFFDDYAKSPDTAINKLYATNAWSSNVKDYISNLKSDLRKFVSSNKMRYVGYELITKKSMSQDLVLYSYLVKYDQTPIRFRFTFYKASDKWFVYTIAWDTKMTDELEQAAKLYNLNLDGN